LKYGVVYYKNTENFGDDIQTYSALKFLPRIDYIIDRESIDTFVPERKEYVAIIMNGWFQHRKYNWPISPYIYPKIVSIHFTSKDPYDLINENENYEYLKGFTKSILKKFEPIGCRDYSTLNALKGIGYKCYFSGCLTLTNAAFTNVEKENYICLVDVEEKIYNKIRKIYNGEIRIMTHKVDSENYSKLSFEERMTRVEEYFMIYQKAKMVITNRLHVALPCLAIGTNVSLIYYEENSDRLETYKEYINTITEKEIMKLKNLNTLFKQKNSNKYQEINKFLKNDCKKFINKTKFCILNKGNLPDIDLYNKFVVERTNFIKNIFLEGINQKKKKINDLQKTIWDLEGTIKWFKENEKEQSKKIYVLNEKLSKEKKGE